MSFLERTVTLEAFAPDLTSPLIVPQTAVVGSGLEFPDIAQWDIPSDGWLTVNGDFNVTSNQLSYTVDDTRFPGFANVPDNAGFNGVVATFDLEDVRIAGVELTVNEFDQPNENIFFNANSIFADFDGLPFNNGDTGVLTVTFADAENAPFDDEVAMFTARLYSAAFGRDPDQPGLNFWIDAYENVGRVGMSEFFLSSPEFEDRFGDPVALSDEGYLDVLYGNILGREGDEAGTAFWMNVLAEDLVSRSEVLAFFVDSEENIANTPEVENLAVSAASGDWFLLT